jgi:phage terminase large subunit-like protein
VGVHRPRREAQRRAWLGHADELEAYYREQAETLRPGTFARLHFNQWQSGEEAFITGEEWDGCVDAELTPLLPTKDVAVSVGVDAATKGDCAAVVAVAREGDRLRLVAHRVWRPAKGQPLDLEETVEAYLRQLAESFRVERVLYDPFQMARSATTLRGAGVRMVEFPQTSANLTAAGQNLFELIRGRNLAMYVDEELRRHALAAVAVDSGRGWRLAKEKSSRKIDGVVALSFAALDAVQRPTGGGGGVAAVVHHGPDGEPTIEEQVAEYERRNEERLREVERRKDEARRSQPDELPWGWPPD